MDPRNSSGCWTLCCRTFHNIKIISLFRPGPPSPPPFLTQIRNESPRLKHRDRIEYFLYQVYVVEYYHYFTGDHSNRTYVTHKNLLVRRMHLPIFTEPIWSYVLWSPAILFAAHYRLRSNTAAVADSELAPWYRSCTRDKLRHIFRKKKEKKAQPIYFIYPTSPPPSPSKVRPHLRVT